MPILKRSLTVTKYAFLLWLAAGFGYAQAQPISLSGALSDEVLGEIHASGINVGGDFSSTCSSANATSMCLGTQEWNDNHQFDASNHKGAIDMSGYVQQNVTTEINLNQTESAGATGVTVIGNTSLSNSSLELTNSNNATNFIGGF